MPCNVRCARIAVIEARRDETEECVKPTTYCEVSTQTKPIYA